MSDYQSTPPSKEKVLERMAGIIRVGHDTHQKEHTTLLASCAKLTEFGNMEFIMVKNEKGIEEKKHPQYSKSKQGVFYQYVNPIISASSTVSSVINQEKMDMFKLENLIPTDLDPLASSLPPPMSPLEQNESQGILGKIFGRKPKRVAHDNDPYQIALEEWKDYRSVVKMLDLFIEYQAYGVRKAMKRSYNWMEQYRSFHYSRFQFLVQPTVIRLHRRYIDHELNNEKKLAVKVATALEKEIARDEKNQFGMR